MTRQLLIYENAEPLSSEAHRDVSVRTGTSWSFAAGLNSVPLVVAEFEKAAAEYPIVFAGEGEAIAPAVILGLRDGENLCLRADGSWDGSYIPAFLRRYPFVFASSGEGEAARLTLCIDTSYEGVNTEGRGERLFDAEGNRTQYLSNMLQFTSDYQTQHQMTKAFAQKLQALDLFEPATATATLPDGQTLSLSGFQRVSPEKLRGLEDAAVLDLFRSDMLGLVHAHLGSLAQMTRLLGKLEARNRDAAA